MSNLKLAILVIFLCGCTVKGEVADHDKNKQLSCIDSRDGERFSLNTNNITNVRAGIGADTCLTLKDDAGKIREICQRHEAWIKCEPTGITKGQQ